MSDPYADYKDDEIPSDKLDQLSALADGWEQATEEVERCAEALDKAQKIVKEIEEVTIPEIMDDIELEKFTTKSGRNIAIKEIVRCNPTNDKKPAAYAWLRANGHSKLLKRTISMDFSVGEDKLAQDFLDLNLKANPEIEMNDKVSVHPGTMAKFAKEKSEAGEELPTDLFPIFRQRVAKIK